MLFFSLKKIEYYKLDIYNTDNIKENIKIWCFKTIILALKLMIF